MALYILQPGIESFGQFDLLNTDLSIMSGGELGVLDKASKTNTSSETAAADALDGYIADGSNAASRVIARIADGYSDTFLDTENGNIKVEPFKTFYLMDDGTAHYGMLLGGLIGSTVGISTSSTIVGPATAAASGKVTLWDKPGLYAVSTDAVAADLGDLTDTPLPGALLYREHNTGKMSSLAYTQDKVAQFIEMTNNKSLVTTPSRLVSSIASYDRIVIQYLGVGFATRNG